MARDHDLVLDSLFGETLLDTVANDFAQELQRVRYKFDGPA